MVVRLAARVASRAFRMTAARRRALRAAQAASARARRRGARAASRRATARAAAARSTSRRATARAAAARSTSRRATARAAARRVSRAVLGTRTGRIATVAATGYAANKQAARRNNRSVAVARYAAATSILGAGLVNSADISATLARSLARQAVGMQSRNRTYADLVEARYRAAWRSADAAVTGVSRIMNAQQNRRR